VAVFTPGNVFDTAPVAPAAKSVAVASTPIAETSAVGLAVAEALKYTFDE
jgi:hypothetical protein